MRIRSSKDKRLSNQKGLIAPPGPDAISASRRYGIDFIDNAYSLQRSMPLSLLKKMETAFDTDFSNVKIHQNSKKAQTVGALAFTQGADVHFAPGCFQPRSSKGQQLIGHELAHVMQQRSSKVRKTTQLGGFPINDDPVLESQAARLGPKAISESSISSSSFPSPSPESSLQNEGSVPVQCERGLKKGMNVWVSFPVGPEIAVPGYGHEPLQYYPATITDADWSGHYKVRYIGQPPPKEIVPGDIYDVHHLPHLYVSASAKPRKMVFKDQKMVPSAMDLEEVRARMQLRQRIQTPNQAWALVAARKKGQEEREKHLIRAKKRLKGFNKSWKTDYTETDLISKILPHLSKLQLVTNYFFGGTPGSKTGSKKDYGGKTLLDLLVTSNTFKNVWETGASQAAVQPYRRGAVEEQMGYAAAVGRTQGRFQDQDDTTSKFVPEKPSELPKYAALVSPLQKSGVASRYGFSYIVWKDSVRQRVTHTPGDSWNIGMGQGVDKYTSNDYPEAIFAFGNEELLRLAAAEATGKDQKWQRNATKNGFTTESYIETQIHGELTWNDVERVVLGYGEDRAEATSSEHAKQMKARLETLKLGKGYNFTIEIRDESEAAD